MASRSEDADCCQLNKTLLNSIGRINAGSCHNAPLMVCFALDTKNSWLGRGKEFWLKTVVHSECLRGKGEKRGTTYVVGRQHANRALLRALYHVLSIYEYLKVHFHSIFHTWGYFRQISFKNTQKL